MNCLRGASFSSWKSLQGMKIGARRGLLMPTGKGGQAAEWMLQSLCAPRGPAVPFAVQRIRCDWHSLAPSVLTLASGKWISRGRTWGGLGDLILTLLSQRSAEAAEHTQLGRSSQACQGENWNLPKGRASSGLLGSFYMGYKAGGFQVWFIAWHGGPAGE